MRITNSNITMASARRYAEQSLNHAGSERFASVSNDVFSRTADRTTENGTEKKPESAAVIAASGDTERDLRSELIGIRDALLQELLKRMLSSGLFGGFNGTFGGFGRAAGFGTSGAFSVGMQAGAGGLTFTRTTYSEEETTAFLARGMAQTDDGRTIDFDVNILMSRAFMQYTQIHVPTFSDALFDPLMINTGSAVAKLSDRTFRFDLDTDGEEDNIAMPEAGTGFLALDANGDGIINDGSELFGVKSGNGFADLAAYDSDGNGWIDENDDVFSRLKVWYKTEDGKDELTDLKTADVGAIYLGNQSTDFSLYGSAFQLNGAVRATGLFLRESGSVGTIQHVDLAKQADAVPAPENGVQAYPASAAAQFTGQDGQGALVIRTDKAETVQQEEEASSGNRTDESKAEKKASRVKKRREEEALRKKAQEKRRAEKEALNRDLAERIQQRRELRREQIEALFEDREAMQERYEELLADKQEEHQALDAALKQEEGTAELVADQIEAVA